MELAQTILGYACFAAGLANIAIGLRVMMVHILRTDINLDRALPNKFDKLTKGDRPMRTIKVTFTDLADASTDTVTTSINGTDEDIRDYYLGRIFDLGGLFDPEQGRLVTATAVEFLN